MASKEFEEEIEQLYLELTKEQSQEEFDKAWSAVTTDRLMHINQFLEKKIMYHEREIYHSDLIADAFRAELDRRNERAALKAEVHTCDECWAMNYPQVNGSYLCCSPEGENGSIVWPKSIACKMFKSRESVDGKTKV